jgi:hypothetical protein
VSDLDPGVHQLWRFGRQGVQELGDDIGDLGDYLADIVGYAAQQIVQQFEACGDNLGRIRLQHREELLDQDHDGHGQLRRRLDDEGDDHVDDDTQGHDDLRRQHGDLIDNIQQTLDETEDQGRQQGDEARDRCQQYAKALLTFTAQQRDGGGEYLGCRGHQHEAESQRDQRDPQGGQSGRRDETGDADGHQGQTDSGQALEYGPPLQGAQEGQDRRQHGERNCGCHQGHRTRKGGDHKGQAHSQDAQGRSHGDQALDQGSDTQATEQGDCSGDNHHGLAHNEHTGG